MINCDESCTSSTERQREKDKEKDEEEVTIGHIFCKRREVYS